MSLFNETALATSSLSDFAFVLQLTVLSMCMGSTSARLAPIFTLSLWIPSRSSFRRFMGRHLHEKHRKHKNHFSSDSLNHWPHCTSAAQWLLMLLLSPVNWPVPVLTPPPLEFLIIWRWGSGVTTVDGMSPSAKAKDAKKVHLKWKDQTTSIFVTSSCNILKYNLTWTWPQPKNKHTQSHYHSLIK